MKELQLWRAFGELDGYICPGGKKRSDINGLVSALKAYTRLKRPRFPFNCLFLAEPGWGKSRLATCLAKYFKFEFLDYSIAQMSSTRDLLDSFRVIVSVQKRANSKVLVFVDETDAPIEGNSALGLFLGPMWDGIFRIQGNTNRIDPCIWVFASTKPTHKLQALPKGPDFLSRINGFTINLDHLNEQQRIEVQKDEDPGARARCLDKYARKNGELGTELVYQGVNLLNETFGPIVEVEEDVLRLFSKINPVHGIRSLSIFVSQFSGITNGVVKKGNVPKLGKTSVSRAGSSGQLMGAIELDRHIRLLNKQWYNSKFIDRPVKSDPVRVLFQAPQ